MIVVISRAGWPHYFLYFTYIFCDFPDYFALVCFIGPPILLCPEKDAYYDDVYCIQQYYRGRWGQNMPPAPRRVDVWSNSWTFNLDVSKPSPVAASKTLSNPFIPHICQTRRKKQSTNMMDGVFGVVKACIHHRRTRHKKSQSQNQLVLTKMQCQDVTTIGTLEESRN